ncbi:MAG: AsmA family protein [Bacteroidales bacterium]|nr:AsmA family protein [Bacteroidales bacterium]
MKRPLKIILLILSGLILLVFVALITVPVIFRDEIKAKVEQTINESVRATVKVQDYRLNFFRYFPDLTLGLDNVSVLGSDKFENDTLAGFRSLNLVFNLPSVFRKTGYEIKSIVLDKALLNVTYLDDGSFNWDISRDTLSGVTEAPDTTSAGMKILLKSVRAVNSSLVYNDHGLDMKALINNLNFLLSGDMTANETDLKIKLDAGDVNFIMDGIKYLSRAGAKGELDLSANLDDYSFTFRENHLTINDLKINFSGWAAMPEDDIAADITFKSEQTSFKTLLSLVPAVYMNDFRDLNATGNFSFSGSARGVYSDADSTMPDISLDLVVNDGLVSYPALPEKISSINLKAAAFVDGKDFDKTVVNIDKFHMELAGNPFDFEFALKTPLSDPDIKVSMSGKLDLDALSNAVPLDSTDLSGLVDVSVMLAGQLSMIDRGEYDSFRASGRMSIKNMLVEMAGYPEIRVNNAGFEFAPAYAALSDADLKIGKNSDFRLSGRLENYIPYILKNETIKGKLDLGSKLIDASEILSKFVGDTTALEDTTALALIKIPGNIDFGFNAAISNFIYGKIRANNVRGQILVKNGVLSVRETGMDILGGTVSVNADYDTRDSIRPLMRAGFNISGIGIRDGFETFDMIQKFAPAARGVDGKVNLNLSFESLLGKDIMPLVNTISGKGSLQSEQVTLIESAAYDRMKELLKLGENYTNTFRDLKLSFTVRNGRVYVNPFDIKAGNVKMNISGDQGIDQTMNYLIKTEIPRSELGSSVNSFIDGLSAQASALGFASKMPADVMKINVRLSGVFGKPLVTPVFGSGSDESASGLKSATTDAIRENVTRTADESREKIIREAEERGDRLIKEAEARARQIREEAVKSAETIRKEADIQAQKLTDEAASKGVVAKLAAQKAAGTIRTEADKKAELLIRQADDLATKITEEAKAGKRELLDRL